MTTIDLSGLRTHEVPDESLKIHTDYCLECLCGYFSREVGESLSHLDGSTLGPIPCPRIAPETYVYAPGMYVYLNPATGKRVQVNVRKREEGEQPTACQVKVACTYEVVYIKLRDLLSVPDGWTLECEVNRDYSEYLPLEHEMRLHRIPDPKRYMAWQLAKGDAERAKQREDDIASLKKSWKRLTGQDISEEATL